VKIEGLIKNTKIIESDGELAKRENPTSYKEIQIEYKEKVFKIRIECTQIMTSRYNCHAQLVEDN
jgi:hypothetical protein